MKCSFDFAYALCSKCLSVSSCYNKAHPNCSPTASASISVCSSRRESLQQQISQNSCSNSSTSKMVVNQADTELTSDYEYKVVLDKDDGYVSLLREE
jgi:hypothetical protein